MTYNVNHKTAQTSVFDALLTGTFSTARTVWMRVLDAVEHLENRRGVEKMLELDDDVLRDIGLNRDDVRWAAQLPLQYKAGEELSKATGRRFSRRRRSFRG